MSIDPLHKLTVKSGGFAQNTWLQLDDEDLMDVTDLDIHLKAGKMNEVVITLSPVEMDLDLSADITVNVNPLVRPPRKRRWYHLWLG